jgi:hypothetical protein
MESGYPVNDGEPQSATSIGILPGNGATPEALPEVSQIFLRNPGAAILHLQGDFALIPGDRDRDSPR